MSSLSLRDYDMTGKSPDEIGAELGVTHILIGNVRRSEDNLRIGCQLVDTKGEETVWAQTYDKKMSNIFAMQSEIATIYAIQNDQDKAIEWLNRLVDDGFIEVMRIKESRLFENLQENEDYIQLIDRLQVKVDSLREEVIRDEMNTTIRSY